jgi:hypothetical protein
MANARENMVAILEDLEVDYSDMMTHPAEFAKRCYLKSLELREELEKKNTMASLEDQFKATAMKNKDAQTAAITLKARIMEMISAQEPETLVHFLTMIPDVTSTAHNIVRSMSARNAGVKVLSKKHIHKMYIAFREGYEKYCNFMKMFQPDNIGNPPVMKVISGNYGDPLSPTSGVKIFHVDIDGNVYMNPYVAAGVLGITDKVSHYMDIYDIIAKSDGSINGFKVELIEV